MEFSDYPDIEEIMVRSLTGSASREELKKLWHWRKQSSHNEQSYRLLEKAWVQQSAEPVTANHQRLEQRILELGFIEDRNSSNRSIQYPWFSKLAAAVALICIVSWAVVQVAPGKEQIETPLEQMVTYNPTGQKSKITLPDKSVIWLNSESSLSYKKGFSDSIRHIQLEGEAYFEVEPDPKRPFVVETGGINTVALGTSFNIRNFPEECSIQISLLSGKVRISDSQAPNELLLEPNEQVRFMKVNRTFKMTMLESDQVSTWKDGIIHFNGSTFLKVVRTLQRTYDVEIDTADYTNTDWSYTGKFDNQSLEIVLTRIGYSEEFEYVIDGRNIKIFDEPE